MTIDILSNDAAECAASLDDNSLGEMISACAQALINVHWFYFYTYAVCTTPENPPLKATEQDDWSQWARTCLANYNALLAYARACCDEWIFRFNEQATYLQGSIDEEQQERVVIMQGLTIKKHKHHDVIAWCESNKPELPGRIVNPNPRDGNKLIGESGEWPLVMPEKYIVYSKCDKTSHFDCASYDNHQPDIIESYRNYYRSRLKKMARILCRFCVGTGEVNGRDGYDHIEGECTDCNGKGYITQAPTFTRRQMIDNNEGE